MTNINNNDIGFLDFVTLASYLMAADNLESTDNFRDAVYEELYKIHKKLDKILEKLNSD